MAGVDQTDLDPGGFQDLEERNPIHAGGFHGDGQHATALEPVPQSEQVFGEGGEDPDRFGVAIWR